VSKPRTASVVVSRQPSSSSHADLLRAQVLRCPLHMLVRKASHEVVAVVVVGLHAKLYALVVASLLGRLNQVLGKKLALFVEVISGALSNVSTAFVERKRSQYTDHVDKHL
jgi:hypothetical protein